MFSFFSKKRVHSNTDSKKTDTISSDISKTSNSHSTLQSGDALVYIWSGDAHNVGHASIQFGTNAPYVSIWPAKIPAIFPLTYFPLPAKLSTKLSDDIKAESYKFELQLENGSETLIRKRNDQEVEPDKIWRIHGLDTSAMEKEAKRITSGVEERTIFYQLYSHIKTTSSEVYDCATLSAHLLKVGGMTSLSKSPLLWKPSAFSDELKRQSNVSAFNVGRSKP